MSNSKSKPVLSISLLCSGKSKDDTIKCLDSLMTIRNKLSSEIIIVDTGCEDDVKSILKKYADRIVVFKWCDDFAKARNAGLEKCSGEWFMFIDDDEWFENTDDIVEFFNSGEYQNYNYAEYRVRNYTDLKGMTWEDFWAVRLVKLSDDVYFKGRIHEYFSEIYAPCKLLKSYVHHYGYVFHNEQELYEKSWRNINLLMQMIREEPDNVHWREQVVQEFANSHDYGRLSDVCNDSIKLIADKDSEQCNKVRADFYRGKLLADNQMYHFNATIDDFNHFKKDRRNNSVCMASLYYQATIAYYRLEDYQNAYNYADKYRNIADKWSNTENAQEKFEEERSLTTRNIFEHKNYNSNLVLLIDSGIKIGKLDVLRKYITKIDWDIISQDEVTSLCKAVVNTFGDNEYRSEFVAVANELLLHDASRDITIFLARQIEELPKNSDDVDSSNKEKIDRIIRILGQTTDCDHWYVLYMKVRYYDMKNDMKELVETNEKLISDVIDIFNLDESYWEIIKKRDINFVTCMDQKPFEKWQKATDEYFAEHGVEQKDKLNLMLDVIGAYDGERVSYFFLKSKEAEISDISNPIHAASKLNEYCTDCISYCKDIYNSRLFTGDMSLLPAQCRFAAKFTEAKEREELKPREVMKKLEECKDIYAPFNPALAEFIKVYGERARDLLLEEGDIERAKLVVPRLKQMYEIIKKLMEILSANKSGDLRTELTKQRRQMDRMLFDITKSWHCELVDTLSRRELSDEDWLKDTDDMIDLLNTCVNDEDNDFIHTYVVNEEIDVNCRIRENVKNNYEFNYLHAMHLKNYLYGCTNMIIGSSMAMNGIDVDKLDGGNADNISFSISRQDLFYDFMNAKKAVEESARPIKNCVIAAGYDLLYRDLSTDKSQNSTVPSVYYRLFGDEALHHYDGNTEYLPLAGIDYYYGEYSEAKDFLSASMRWSDDFFISQPTYYNDMMTRTEVALKSGIDKEWKVLYPQESGQKAFDSCHSLAKLLDDTKNRDENIAILTEMTKYLYDNGIRIVYLIMPYARKCIRYIDPEFKLKTENVLEKLPYPVEYLDMNDMKGIFTDEDFIDAWNLNELGAEKATKVLREFLIR